MYAYRCQISTAYSKDLNIGFLSLRHDAGRRLLELIQELVVCQWDQLHVK